MYTHCPDCGTVYRIGTADLRVADGYVCCGHCETTFNALATLSDEPAQLGPPAPGSSQAESPEPDREPEPEPEPESPELEWPAPELPETGSGNPDGTGDHLPTVLAVEASDLDAGDETLDQGAEDPESITDPQTQPEVVAVPESGAGVAANFDFDVPEDGWSHFFTGDNGPSRPRAPEARHSPDEMFRVVNDDVEEIDTGEASAPDPAAVDDDSAEWQALLSEMTDDDEDTDPVYVVDDAPGSANADSTDKPRAVRDANDASAETEAERVDIDISAGFQDLDDTADLPVLVIADDGLPELTRNGALVDDPSVDVSSADVPSVEDISIDDISIELSAEDVDDAPGNTGEAPTSEPALTEAGAAIPAEDGADPDGDALLDPAIPEQPVWSEPAWYAPGSALRGPADEGPAKDAVADRPFVWHPPAPPPEPRRHSASIAGCTLLALLLVAQVIHHQRDELATHPTVGPWVTQLYGALGQSLLPAWDVRAYEVRATEAVGGSSERGVLDVAARIAVVGTDSVGLPLVRVTLHDRRSRPIAQRIFTATEYLEPSTSLGAPLMPGATIPVRLRLADPGTQAYGYEIDVCLRNRREGLICQADREPFAR